MEMRRVGSLEVSVVGLGCNNFGGRLDAYGAEAVVRAAIDRGINFFDTADIYGATASEEILGRQLQGIRDRVVIATKFGMPLDSERRGARPEYVHKALDASLRRLGTDRIDLYQLHEPDPDTPIGDTLDALNRAVEAGKVREIGCSNFSPGQLEQAAAASAEGGARFVSVQNHLSILHRDPEQTGLDAASSLGMSFLPFYPLERGLLTGKFSSGVPTEGTRIAGLSADLRAEVMSEANLSTVASLDKWASDRGHSILELAFAWLLAHDNVPSVIAGAMTPEQVKANGAAGHWTLSPTDMTQLDALLDA